MLTRNALRNGLFIGLALMAGGLMYGTWVDPAVPLNIGIKTLVTGMTIFVGLMIGAAISDLLDD